MKTWGIVWTKKRGLIEVFRGDCERAKNLFNVFVKSGDSTLGEKIGLTYFRIRNGDTEQMTIDIRYK